MSSYYDKRKNSGEELRASIRDSLAKMREREHKENPRKEEVARRLAVAARFFETDKESK
jgi:hypothetical protein